MPFPGIACYEEGVAMVCFQNSSFGRFLVCLFDGIFTVPSFRNFLILAYGWAFSTRRHFVTTFIWLSGGVLFKHFSRFYSFLGGAFYKHRDGVFARIIRFAVRFVPEEESVRVLVDDTTIKRVGHLIEGLGYYRNGAGTARQEYRTLKGNNFVYAVMLIQCPLWPGVFFPVPIGLELYLKEGEAKKLRRKFRSRGALAQRIVKSVAKELPGRRILVIGDGGYTNKEFLPGLPKNVAMVGRMMVTGTLYEEPDPYCGNGRPAKKGKKIGSPKTLARTRKGWQSHPTEDGAQIQSWVAIWHTALPGRKVKVVLVRRKKIQPSSKNSSRRPKKKLEAFLSTDLSLSDEQILQEYTLRWAVEIDIRDANEFYGLGRNRCRKYERVVGANSFCLALAAARTLWFFKSVQESKGLDLQRLRPWFTHKQKPSQLDIAWACHECLTAEGVSPAVRFFQDLREAVGVSPKSLDRAA